MFKANPVYGMPFSLTIPGIRITGDKGELTALAEKCTEWNFTSHIVVLVLDEGSIGMVLATHDTFTESPECRLAAVHGGVTESVKCQPAAAARWGHTPPNVRQPLCTLKSQNSRVRSTATAR